MKLFRFGLGASLIDIPMLMYCDNQTVIFIVNNPVFHEKTKDIDVDCHYVRDTVMKGIILTLYVSSSEQLASSPRV